MTSAWKAIEFQMAGITKQIQEAKEAGQLEAAEKLADEKNHKALELLDAAILAAPAISQDVEILTMRKEEIHLLISQKQAPVQAPPEKPSKLKKKPSLLQKFEDMSPSLPSTEPPHPSSSPGVADLPPPPTTLPPPPFLPPPPEESSDEEVEEKDETEDWDQEKIEKKKLQRANIVQEIYDTENTYLQQLDALEELYIIPMQAGTILPIKTCDLLFANIRSIKEMNKGLLADIGDRIKSESTKLSDLFIEFVPILAMYNDYCQKNVGANLLLTKLLGAESKETKFKEFCNKQVSDPRSRGLALNSLLIAAVQRVPRYKLLIQELIKNTHASHPDKHDLKKALGEVANAAKSINEAIRAEETRQELKAMSEDELNGLIKLEKPNRRLIKKGILMKVCRSANKPYHTWLFNDLLLLAAKSGKKIRSLNHELPIKNGIFAVRNVPLDVQRSKDIANGWEIVNDQKSFIVFADSQYEKMLWYKAMQASMEESGASIESLNNTAATWKSDKEVSHCPFCARKFTFTLRRHHCRLCGEVVCDSCSKDRVGDKKQRACFACAEHNTGARKKKLPGSLHEGYINKRGQSNKAYKRRYFVLLQNRLDYYKDDHALKPLGSIDMGDDIFVDIRTTPIQLQNQEALPEDDSDEKDSPELSNFRAGFKFYVHPKGSKLSSDRVFELKCATQEGRTVWINAIKQRKEMSALQLVDGVDTKKDSDSIREGYLHKQGADITANWKKRYFVLTANQFKYYKDERSVKPAGTVDLSFGVNIKIETEAKKQKDFMFSVAPPKARKYMLAADSLADRDGWIEAIRTRQTLVSVVNRTGRVSTLAPMGSSKQLLSQVSNVSSTL